ncbi:NACHT domain-containing protein [Catellatospora vulcania]|uniref:NACHT domain-containing protein n=1 Tax=Catellatospora vulcania TaxID=1460450 RepID=UPI0012D4A0EB|nr:NACHT domain-containing protein [Catellatospora vulcania]
MNGPEDRSAVRRYFIGAATTEYAPSTNLIDLPELVAELQRATDLFTGLDYQVVQDFGVNLSAVEFTGRLRAFLRSPERRADDMIAVYYTGHGEVAASKTDLLLPMADATADRSFSFLRAGDLTGRVLDSDTPGEMVGQRLLFVLDTCYAGAAGGALAAGAVGFVERLRRTAGGPAIAVIVSTRDYQQAGVGTFTQALARSVQERAIAGHEVPFLPLEPLITQVNAELADAAAGGAVSQQARLFYFGERSGEFFPNRQYSRWYSDLDVRTRELRLQQEARRTDRERTARIGQGLDPLSDRDDLWLFTGRHAALRRASAWLADADPPTLVITGDPGSGKSALLARLDTLADPGRSARVPDVHVLPPDTVPPRESIDRFIHARGLTPVGLLAGLAEACGIDDIAAVDSPGKLIAQLRNRTEPVVVVIDGVDEAAGELGDTTVTGIAMVEQVLAPLVRTARRTPLRLLIGTRRHLIGPLGTPVDVINLDRARYADQPSLHQYVHSCLTRLVEASPYAGQRTEYLGAVVDAVAAAAGDSFLVALITARSLALRGELVADPYDAAWQASLPREAAGAMRGDLDERLGDEAAKARDLLLPLAYAQASGLPWEDLWPRLVTRLTGRPCSNRDLDWLFEKAGYYIIESRLGNSSVYRLYHAALAEHLLIERQGSVGDGRGSGLRDSGDVKADAAAIARADHRAIFDLLVDRVPRRPDGTRDWAMAHPYTAAAIAGHAAQADCLDALLAEPRLLTDTQAEPLLTALHRVRTPQARATADAYQRAVARMQAHPAERAAYLQLAARCARAPHLADDITASGLPLPWTTHWASWRMHPPHQTLTRHRGPVTAVALGDVAGRAVVASASGDRKLCLWNATTGRPIGEPLVGHTDWVTAVAFGQLDGRTVVVSGGRDGTVRRWDAATALPLPGRPFRHRGPVRTVAFGQLFDRAVIVSGGEDDLVMVWDAATGEVLGRPLAGHTGGVYAVAVGDVRGQGVVATACTDGLVRLWDPATGSLFDTPYSGHSGRVKAVAFGRLGDDAIVVSGGEDRTVQVWSAETGRLVTDPYTGHVDHVNAVAFGRRGSQPVVVSGGNDRTVQVSDVVTGRQIGVRLTGHNDWVSSVAFGTRDGRPVIVSGGEDDTVRLWDAASGEPVGEPFTGHADTVDAVAFGDLAGQPIVVSGGGDRTVRLWDAASGQPFRAPLTGHTGAVTAVAFGAVDGQPVVASGGDDQTIRLWDAASGKPVGEPATDTGPVRSLALGAVDGRTVVASGGADETVRLWDAASGRAAAPPLLGHEGAVNTVAFGDLDGRPVIASGGGDRTVRLWDAASGLPVGEPLTGHRDAVTAVAFGAVDGQPVVASGSDDETVRVWYADSGEPVGAAATGAGAIRSVAFGQLGRQPIVIAGGADARVRVSDAVTGETVGTLYATPGGVRSVAFGRLGRQPIVIAGGADRALRAWDAATGQVVAAPFAGHLSPVTAIAFGRLDGALVVASGSTDHTVRLWDAATGRPLAAPFTGHADGVRSVVFGQVEGRTVIVSAGDDRTVRTWDAATGEPFGEPFTGHRSWVNSVAFGRLDGRPVIVSGSNDHKVQIWDAQTQELCCAPIDAHHGYVRSVAFASLHGRPVVVSGGDDHVVRLWDARTGEPVGEPLTGHTAHVNAVAVGEAGDCLLVVSAGNDGTVRTWEAATGEPAGAPFTGHEGWVHAAAIDRHGDRTVVVSGGADQTLWVRAAPGETDTQPAGGTRIRLNATVNCVAVRDATHVVVGTELGIVSLRLPG